MRKRDSTQCALPSYPGVLCLWDSGTTCRESFLFDSSRVKYRLHECITSGIVQYITQWHKAGGLDTPENIELLHIPPYTPEMNPIEQIWKEVRKRGFCNEVFATLSKVTDRLSNTICSLSDQNVAKIIDRSWIFKCFLQNQY